METSRVRRIRRWLGRPVGRRLLLAGLVLGGGLTALGAGLAVGAWRHVCDDCPSIAQIYAFEPKEASRVFAADGTLLAELAVERRTAVPFAALPPYLPLAFVAVEDRRFWDHRGIDLWRTFRAGVEFLVRGYDVAGGSTITQQLAGNMFSDAVNRRVISIRRKLKEMRVALALERAYTKREILEAYVNQINFGDGHYGVQSAARYYFGKDARNLNLPEAATLAALPKAPQRYSPFDHPESALQRRNLVLRLMSAQGMIDPATARRAMAYPLVLDRDGGATGSAPYFVEWVRRLLIDRYGTDLYEAGLRIHTTLRPELQAVADSALRAQLRWVEEQPGFRAPVYREGTGRGEGERANRTARGGTAYLQGAFVALDPRDGSVLALVGGRDFSDSEFNRVTQARRQPGSVFKPFVYTAALDTRTFSPSDVLVDAPIEILLPDSTVYSPKNFGDVFRGAMTLREALYRSVNVIAVKVGQEVGVESIAQYARRMGISTPIPRVPSLSIGAASVVPLEVAEAYTTFANLGVRVTARPILRVENSRGETLWESVPEREEVLDRQTSWLMVDILRDVLDRGTATVVRRRGLPPEVPAAGKTGTTNEATDAWFVGFTPEIVTATWVGFDEPARLHRNAQGGVDAAPVGAEVLLAYYRDRPAPSPWPRPDGLVSAEVDRSSGGLATPWCPADSLYTEYYLPGTEPQAPCELHGPWRGGDFTGGAEAAEGEARNGGEEGDPRTGGGGDGGFHP